jgi:Flp pilus assembly pilin Flp
MRLSIIRRSERGQALLEYATIVALVGTCLVAILGLVGNATRKTFDRTSSPLMRQASVGGGGGSGHGVPAIPASNPGEPDSSGAGGQDPDSTGGAEFAH